MPYSGCSVHKIIAKQQSIRLLLSRFAPPSFMAYAYEREMHTISESTQSHANWPYHESYNVFLFLCCSVCVCAHSAQLRTDINGQVVCFFRNAGPFAMFVVSLFLMMKITYCVDRSLRSVHVSPAGAGIDEMGQPEDMIWISKCSNASNANVSVSSNTKSNLYCSAVDRKGTHYRFRHWSDFCLNGPPFRPLTAVGYSVTFACARFASLSPCMCFIECEMNISMHDHWHVKWITESEHTLCARCRRRRLSFRVVHTYSGDHN